MDLAGCCRGTLCVTPVMEGLPEKLHLKSQCSQTKEAAPCPAKPSTMCMTTAKRCRAAQDLASTACTSCSWCSGKAQKTIVSKAQDCCWKATTSWKGWLYQGWMTRSMPLLQAQHGKPAMSSLLGCCCLLAAKLHVTCCQGPQMLWHCSLAVLPQTGWRLPLRGAFEIFKPQHQTLATVDLSQHQQCKATFSVERHSIDNGNLVGISKEWLGGPIGTCGMSDPTKGEQAQRSNDHLGIQLFYAEVHGVHGNSARRQAAALSPEVSPIHAVPAHQSSHNLYFKNVDDHDASGLPLTQGDLRPMSGALNCCGGRRVSCLGNSCGGHLHAHHPRL